MSIDGLHSLLGWIALINYLLLTIWFLLYCCCRDFIYRLHSRWFALSREQFAAIHYGTMALFKTLTFMLFLAPWLALHILGG